MANPARFFTLFYKAQKAHKHDFTDYKDMLLQWTSGKKDSFKALTDDERRSLEEHLQNMVNPVASAADRMRRKVIACLRAHGCNTPDGKADMVRINAWCVKYGHAHKALNHVTNAELPRLVTQAERVNMSDLKAIAANG